MRFASLFSLPSPVNGLTQWLAVKWHFFSTPLVLYRCGWLSLDFPVFSCVLPLPCVSSAPLSASRSCRTSIPVFHPLITRPACCHTSVEAISGSAHCPLRFVHALTYHCISGSPFTAHQSASQWSTACKSASSALLTSASCLHFPQLPRSFILSCSMFCSPIQTKLVFLTVDGRLVRWARHWTFFQRPEFVKRVRSDLLCV